MAWAISSTATSFPHLKLICGTISKHVFLKCIYMSTHTHTHNCVCIYTKPNSFRHHHNILWVTGCMWKPHREIRTMKRYPVASSCALPPLAFTPGQMEKATLRWDTVSASSTLSAGPTWTIHSILQTCCFPLASWPPSLQGSWEQWGSSIRMMNAKESHSCPCIFSHAKCPAACLDGSVHSLVFCWHFCGCLCLEESPPSSLLHLGLGIRGQSLTLCFLSPPVLVHQPLGLYPMVPDHKMLLTQPVELESLAMCALCRNIWGLSGPWCVLTHLRSSLWSPALFFPLLLCLLLCLFLPLFFLPFFLLLSFCFCLFLSSLCPASSCLPCLLSNTFLSLFLSLSAHPTLYFPA